MTSEKERETGKKKRSEERKGKFARAQVTSAGRCLAHKWKTFVRIYLGYRCPVIKFSARLITHVR